MVLVTEDLEIPDAELTFATSRSSGPGGQNVNKLDTRVTLLFDVEHSPSLGEVQRIRIFERLAGRINKDGVMRVVSQRHRTQYANRQEVIRRFAGLVSDALADEPARIPVTPPRAMNERRLQTKRIRSRLKRGRGDVEFED